MLLSAEQRRLLDQRRSDERVHAQTNDEWIAEYSQSLTNAPDPRVFPSVWQVFLRGRQVSLDRALRGIERLEAKGFTIHFHDHGELYLAPSERVESVHIEFLRQERDSILTILQARDAKKAASDCWVYQDFAVVCGNSIAMRFVNARTGAEGTAFFRVDLHRRRSGRGKTRGQRYSNPRQFFPRERSKFRQLWVVTFGKEPSQWSDVWRSMGAFKACRFKATRDDAPRKNGDRYIRLKGLVRIGKESVARR